MPSSLPTSAPTVFLKAAAGAEPGVIDGEGLPLDQRPFRTQHHLVLLSGHGRAVVGDIPVPPDYRLALDNEFLEFLA